MKRKHLYQSSLWVCLYAVNWLTGLVGRAFRQKRWWAMIGVMLLWGGLDAMPVYASTITVTTTIPDAVADGQCSIIEAIENANADLATHADCPAGSGTDTIVLPTDSTITLTSIYTTYYSIYSGLPLITSDIIIEGNGTTIQRDPAAPNFSIIFARSVSNIIVNHLTIREGYMGIIATDSKLTINNCYISDNEYGVSGFNIHIHDSVIADNIISVQQSDGELYIRNSEIIRNGLGINLGGERGTTTIENSTIANNGTGISLFGSNILTLNYTTIANNYRRGGIRLWATDPTTAILNHSTISGNISEDRGGGIYTDEFDGPIELIINYSTITNNSASVEGGGIYAFIDYTANSLQLNRSIVSGNTAPTSPEIGRYASLNPWNVTSSYNILGHSGNAGIAGFTPSSTDIVPTQPFDEILNPVLVDNSGDTLTHALVAGSPALEAIPATDPSCISGTTLDQRGLPRANGVGMGGDACDIGAYEAQNVALALDIDRLPSHTEAQLSWNAVLVDHFQIWRSPTPSMGYTLLTDTYSGNTYNVPIDPTTNYFYQVVGIQGGVPVLTSEEVGVFSFGIDRPILAPPNYVAQWGTLGTGMGQFDTPFDITVDSAGTLYVADTTNHRIQKFDSSGTYLGGWGSFGNGNGEFDRPQGIAVDDAGHVYVVDRGNHRIQKFDSSGTYLTQWGRFGSGDGELGTPQGIDVDNAGNVYVTEWANHRVQKFASSGTYLTQWGSLGSGDGQFEQPTGIAIDDANHVYVVDRRNHRVQKFDSAGNYLLQWGTVGIGDSQFNNPIQIGINTLQQVFISDRDNHRVQIFNPYGSYLTQWGSLGSGDGQFNEPGGLTIHTSHEIFVVDRLNHRIQKFVPAP